MSKLIARIHPDNTSSSCTVNYQNIFHCFNRFATLILSLLCIQFVLTQKAAALNIPTLAVLRNTPTFGRSLVRSLPENNAGGSNKMATVLQQETSSKLAVNVLTSGQQVINAIPDKERADFITHQLAIALIRTCDDGTKQMWCKNLPDVVEFYGNKLTTLQNVPIYESFPTDLLQWLEQNFNLTHQIVYTQRRSRSLFWCTPQGVCYSHNDIGCYCCPF